MTDRSKYDLTPEYRTKLVGLINDALDVYRQYEYADFTDGDYSVSYKRNGDWFLEGLLPRIKNEKRGFIERDKLRKGTKNYCAIFRDDGIIRKIVSFIDGSLDVSYYAVYKGNRRYLLPFSDVWKGRYPTYIIVAEYGGEEIIREYMVQDAQIVFDSYVRIAPTEYQVERINYVPKGTYPVLGCDTLTVSAGSEAVFSEQKSYSWYDEFSCSKKGVPFSPDLPKCMMLKD